MANIKIELDHPLADGEQITFKAPCDCTAVTGMVVHYPDASGESTLSQTFGFRDSHNNNISNLGNLFLESALVAVIVNTGSSVTHIINADTNKYLEDKIAAAGSNIELSSSVTSSSTITAANSYAAKKAYDKGVEALNKANQAYNLASSAIKVTTHVIELSDQSWEGSSGNYQCRIQIPGFAPNLPFSFFSTGYRYIGVEIGDVQYNIDAQVWDIILVSTANNTINFSNQQAYFHIFQ